MSEDAVFNETLRQKVAALIYRRATSNDPNIANHPAEVQFDELCEIGLYPPKVDPGATRDEAEETQGMEAPSYAHRRGCALG
jgi:hypothetical protein